MPESERHTCGWENPPDAPFCENPDCDERLERYSPPPVPRPRPPGPDDATKQAPQVDLAQSEATLEQGVGAAIEMRIRNTSSIVAGYRIELVTPPAWLTITQPDIRILPGDEESITATFGIAAGTFVEAQTVEVDLRICSVLDTSQFANARVTLAVPRVGPPVSIRSRPAVVSLLDRNSDRFHIILDNTKSNYARRLELAGSDTEDAVTFEFSRTTVEVAARASENVEVGFSVPVLHGENRMWQLTIAATEGDDTATTTVTVQSKPVPLHTRLEPSVLRTRDGLSAELSLIIDNRAGTQDRALSLSGRDPEGAVHFSFATPQIVIRAGELKTTRLSIAAPKPPMRIVAALLPPMRKEVSRPFTVVADDGGKETEASGTLVQTGSSVWTWAAIIVPAVALLSGVYILHRPPPVPPEPEPSTAAAPTVTATTPTPPAVPTTTTPTVAATTPAPPAVPTTTEPPPPPPTSEVPPPPPPETVTVTAPPPPPPAPAPEPSPEPPPPAPASAAPAPPPTTPTGPRQVTYSVTGTKAPGDIITVTYVDGNGNRRTLRNVYIPWTLTMTPTSDSDVGSVEAASLFLVSRLNCSITTSDGTVLSSNQNNSAQTAC